ncbi:MAG: ABC transporter permease subunit [Akkermansiaceae bacterium]|nr:ABC transporter permease subunit [Akkermansiaceae bacterium]
MPAFFSFLWHMPARIAAVAGVTFIQLMRMRLFAALAVVGIGFLALQFVPYQQNLGVEFQGVGQLQLMKDIALGCMRLFCMLFCVAAAALLIPKDTEDRILYTILCKPVPRFAYLAGKALGVLLLMGLMLLVMDGLLALLLHLREAVIEEEVRLVLTDRGWSAADMQPYLQQVAEAGNSWNLQRSIVAMFLGFGVLTTFTLFLSCMTSGTIVSMLFALGAYFIGMFQGQLFHSMVAAQGGGEGVTLLWTERVVSILLPDFSLFSITDAASAGAELSGPLLGGLALIALAYMLLHLLAASWIFANKEF